MVNAQESASAAWAGEAEGELTGLDQAAAEAARPAQAKIEAERARLNAADEASRERERTLRQALSAALRPDPAAGLPVDVIVSVLAGVGFDNLDAATPGTGRRQYDRNAFRVGAFDSTCLRFRAFAN